MTYLILSNLVASISELKKHPMQVIDLSQDQPIAILNRNQPVCYCISPKMFELIMDKLEDEELAQIISKRSNEHEIEVKLNDL